MQFDLDVITTLVIAIVVLLIGRALIGRIGFLRRYNIPEPVVGGLVAAGVVTALRFGADVQVNFDLSLQGPLMLAFFATIGLGADVRTLLKGGRKLLLFWLLLTGMLLLQNAAGLALAWSMDLHPLVGLLAGSITLMGGHGTGAAYAGGFVDVDNLQGAMELAMACATFGLVLGGLLGGPVTQRLIQRHGLSARPDAGGAGEGAGKRRRPASRAKAAPPAPDAEAAAGSAQPLADTASRQAAAQVRLDAAAAQASPAPPAAVAATTPQAFIEALLMVTFCVAVGSWLGQVMQNDVVTLPTFVWTLFTGVLVRNTLSLSGLREVDDETVSLLGSVSLSLFLSMALISLRLWELVSLALPILVILAIQTVLAALYISFLTFRVMGADYDAAVISAGHCGLALGATPTAIANMQAITAKYGPSPQAFLIIPIVGAFLIDITNALFLQGFLALPLFGF